MCELEREREREKAELEKSKKNKESGEGTGIYFLKNIYIKVDKSCLRGGSGQATTTHQRRDLTGDLTGNQRQQNPTLEAEYNGVCVCVCVCGYWRALLFRSLYCDPGLGCSL